MNVLKTIVPLLIVLGAISTQAADFSGITVNGEAAFDFNFVSSKSANYPNSDGNGLSLGNESYRLAKAQLLLKKETDDISFTGRLAYTPMSYNDGSKTTKAYFGALEQMELFYKINPQLQIGFGRFLTTMGYESLMKYENAFYSPTVAYQAIVPGYGEGLRVRYLPGTWLTATLSTYNQFNYGAIGEDLTPTKATELSFLSNLDNLTLFAGYLMGTDASTTTPGTNEDKTSMSIWASYKFLPNLMLAITYDAKTTKPVGFADIRAESASGVLTYTVDIHNLGLRYEKIRNASNISYGTADKVDVISITDKIALSSNLNVYVEYRMDKADQKVFFDKDGAAADTANIVTLGALAYF